MATVSPATGVAAAGSASPFSPKTLKVSPFTVHFPKSEHHSFTPIKSSSSSSSFSSPLTSTTNISLKNLLSTSQPLYGLFLLSDSPTLAEIAGLAGYDFVVVDLEHGPSDISTAVAILRALAATQTPAIIRLPESSPVWAKKALDLGPAGLMFPMVDSSAAAEDVVSFCRYPPRGVRGSAHTVVRASGYGVDDGYLSRCEDDLFIMCQVESAKGVEKIEEIACVDGVDCIQMGPLDLSASLGFLWDPGNQKVRAVMREAEKRVLEVSKRKGVYLGGFAMPHDKPDDLKTRGYHMVSGAVDLGMFRKAAVSDVAEFRKAATEIGAEDSEEKDEGYWSE